MLSEGGLSRWGTKAVLKATAECFTLNVNNHLATEGEIGIFVGLDASGGTGVRLVRRCGGTMTGQGKHKQTAFSTQSNANYERRGDRNKCGIVKKQDAHRSGRNANSWRERVGSQFGLVGLVRQTQESGAPARKSTSLKLHGRH